jgi:phosphoglycolate phosphatase
VVEERPVKGRGVVFDLDGTLVDSRRDLASAVNATRERLALPPLQVTQVEAMVGEGARLLVRRALPSSVDGEELERALAVFLELYFERCLDATTVYPGMAELLAELAARGPVALLTNKPERHSRKILAAFGLDRWLAPILGGDSLPVRKPDPGGLLAIAAGWGRELDGVVLVGDSAIDAQTAVAAGAPLVLVEWGYGRPEQLASFAAPRARDAAALRALLD